MSMFQDSNDSVTMRKLFMSFADYRYQSKQADLSRSAQAYFHTVYSFGPNDIDPDFFEENKSILIHPKGAGYWVWKPYFLLKCFESMSDGDVLFYADAGNTIVNDFRPLFDLLESTPTKTLLFFNRGENDKAFTNRWYTKYDCFHLMDCLGEEFFDGDHADAAYQVYEKNEFNKNFLEEYLKYCLNWQIISDSKSIHGQEFQDYRDHRHDQSVLSNLAIKYKIHLHPQPDQYGIKDYLNVFDHHR